jgi:hypothetical protein
MGNPTELTPRERELLVGSWFAIALIADALARAGALDRLELLDQFVVAEEIARKIDRRYLAVRGVREFLERFTPDEAPPGVRRRRKAPPDSGPTREASPLFRSRGERLPEC